MLCVFTATIFWLFNALNKTYTTNINFPLSFEYDRDHFVPVGSLPQSVRLNVTGNGWELFKRSTGLKTDPLMLPLERTSEIKKIEGSGLRLPFSSQLEGLQVNHVLNDTLHVDLEPKTGRWIKLAVDSIKYNLKKNFGLTSEVAIMPDSTYVEGPKRIIDKIKEPVMLSIPQRNIDEYYLENIPVELPFRELAAPQPSTVSVMFNVAEMIVVQDSIAIEIENIPGTVSEVMNPGKIPVVLSIPETSIEELRMDSVKAILDLRNFKGGTKKILPRIQGLPPYSSVLKIDSVVVRL